MAQDLRSYLDRVKAEMPGDFVTVVDGREAALVLPETYVPIDVAIIGIVEEVTRLGTNIEPTAHLAAEGA